MTDIIIIITYQVVCENNMDGYILQIVSILILRYFSSFIFVFLRPAVILYVYEKHGVRWPANDADQRPPARSPRRILSSLSIVAACLLCYGTSLFILHVFVPASSKFVLLVNEMKRCVGCVLRTILHIKYDYFFVCFFSSCFLSASLVHVYFSFFFLSFFSTRCATSYRIFRGIKTRYSTTV